MRAFSIILMGLVTLFTSNVHAKPESFVLDWPLRTNQIYPAWLLTPQSTSGQLISSTQFKITPRPQLDLAITFYFSEKRQGFLRLFWAGATKAEMVSENLFEGIFQPNQRTLLLAREFLNSPGILTIQASSPQWPVTRMVWEWVERKTVFAAQGATVPTLFKGDGQKLTQHEVSGNPPLPLNDYWRGPVITAYLTEKPEAVELGKEFIAPLQAAPRWAKLKGKFNGLAPGRYLAVWLNGVKIGYVTLSVPELYDPGYRIDRQGQLHYSGWREGELFLPARFLQKGDNKFEFWPADSTAPTNFSVKELCLQLRYPPPTRP